ncbi:MAG: prepilin-type N-terminal cleavage/methylation domain-containing protein, partial [Capsulimonadaceae bacterium]
MMTPISKSKNRQRGLTLIEILIVLIILVIGILYVIRLFPAGFAIQRESRNTTAASRFAQQAIEVMTREGAPDGVYAGSVCTVTSGGSAVEEGLVFDPTISPDSIGTQNALAGITATAYGNTPPAGPTVYGTYSDINKVRYVHNESFTLVQQTMFHVLNYGPIVISNVNAPQYDVNVV